MESNHQRKRSSKIVSVESTADGDIQTVEEIDTTNTNDSVKAFTHHLRDSWDDANNVGGENATPMHHKQNLSVQFLDISISGDDRESMLGNASIAANANRGGRRLSTGKETIESAASYYFDAPDTSSAAAGPASEEHARGENNTSNNDDYTSFTNSIRDSWGNQKRSPTKSTSRHKQNMSSVQFLDSQVMEYDVDDLVENLCRGEESEDGGSSKPLTNEEAVATTMTNAKAFEPPAPTDSTSQRDSQSQLLSSSNGSGINSRGGRTPLSPISDSPISGNSPISSQSEIVVPIPLRPGTTVVSGANRKHRRVFSGRSNPAMVHRRVNTRGDKCAPPNEFCIEDANEGNREEQQRGRKKVFAGGRAPNQQPRLEPPSPNTAAMPPPIPMQQHQPHPTYYHGTTPPSYDPYNNAYAPPPDQQPPPPHPSYAYGTPPPPQPNQYYNSSPQSDAGVHYGHRSSPVFSGYPPPIVQPPQAPYNQHPPPSAQPGDGYPGMPPTRRSSTSSGQPTPPISNMTNTNRPSNGNYSSLPMQPSLDDGFPAAQDGDENLLSKEERPNIHLREESFNPLPYKDENEGHHRKQSSIGSFLATAGIFDEDPNQFYEDEGYVSAPEEGAAAHSHKQTLSSMSFMRSLSSDNLLRHLTDDDRELSDDRLNENAPMQQSRPPPLPPQQPPQALPLPPAAMRSRGNSSDGGYNSLRSSPVVSAVASPYNSLQSSPVVSGVPPPPSPPGYPPTPPGYYNYPYGATPPQAHQPMQYFQPPPMPHPQYTPPPQHHSPMVQPQYGYQPPPSNAIPPQPGSYMQTAPRQPLPETAGSSATQQSTFFCHDASEKSRSRRKCSVADCPNRVVQGGLCIAHGAKRKTCSHPGCTKNVKKAGMCSTHGPARKRCEVEGCTKVAVQAGRCIAHGAKKKVCSIELCTKQAILAGMCKKHHDETHGVVKQPRGARGKKPAAADVTEGAHKKGGHERGLSLFQDSDLMKTIIDNGNTATSTDEDGLRGLSFDMI